jgi:hypothetical protein
VHPEIANQQGSPGIKAESLESCAPARAGNHAGKVPRFALTVL